MPVTWARATINGRCFHNHGVGTFFSVIVKTDLGEGEAGRVHHDGEVEAGQHAEAEAGEHPDAPVKPPLQVGVGRAVLAIIREILEITFEFLSMRYL